MDPRVNITIYPTKELKTAIDAAAAAEGRSTTNWIMQLIIKFMGGKK